MFSFLFSAFFLLAAASPLLAGSQWTDPAVACPGPALSLRSTGNIAGTFDTTCMRDASCPADRGTRAGTNTHTYRGIEMGVDYAFIAGFTCFIAPQMDPFEYKTTRVSITVGNPIDPDIPIVASVRSTGDGLAFQQLLTGAPIEIAAWTGDLETISIANSNDNTLRIETSAALSLENNVRTNEQTLVYCSEATLGYSNAQQDLAGVDYVNSALENFFRSGACTKCTLTRTPAPSTRATGSSTGGTGGGTYYGSDPYATGVSYTGGYAARTYVPNCASLLAGSNVYDFLAPYGAAYFLDQEDVNLRCATNLEYFDSFFAGTVGNANAASGCVDGPAVSRSSRINNGTYIGLGVRPERTGSQAATAGAEATTV